MRSMISCFVLAVAMSQAASAAHLCEGHFELAKGSENCLYSIIVKEVNFTDGKSAIVALPNGDGSLEGMTIKELIYAEYQVLGTTASINDLEGEGLSARGTIAPKALTTRIKGSRDGFKSLLKHKTSCDEKGMKVKVSGGMADFYLFFMRDSYTCQYRRLN